MGGSNECFRVNVRLDLITRCCRKANAERSLLDSKAVEVTTVCFQDQVPGTSTSMVLKNLDPDTEYTVTVVPVYPEMEGKPQSENGKTSECLLSFTVVIKAECRRHKVVKQPV